MKAIAAMSLNGVIGNGNTIPWHLPADFRWFKSATENGILIMGRKTVESLPAPRKTVIKPELPGYVTGYDISYKLPGRPILTLSGRKSADEIMDMVKLIEDNQDVTKNKDVWVCGGGQIYNMLLEYCTELYLTRVQREVKGDVFFPEFEHLFDQQGIVMENDDFVVEKWTRRTGGIRVLF